jgi:hypothetical protein
MRSATGLISDLTKLGARLIPDGDKLRVDAPKGILTNDVRMELSRNKLEILRVLQSPSSGCKDHSVIDGHCIKRKVWETEKDIVYEDIDGRFWRYLHAYNTGWPVFVWTTR